MDNYKYSIAYKGQPETSDRFSRTATETINAEKQREARDILFSEQYIRPPEQRYSRDEARDILGVKRKERELENIVEGYTQGHFAHTDRAEPQSTQQPYHGSFLNSRPFYGDNSKTMTETAVREYVVERSAEKDYVIERPASYRAGTHTTIPSRLPKDKNEAYIMPSENTMIYAGLGRNVSFEKEEAVAEDTDTVIRAENERKTDGSLKMIAAIYISIVVVLATLIVATGMLIKNLNGDINALEESIDYQVEIMTAQNETLGYVSSEEFIETRAGDLGMVKDGEVGELALPPMKEVPVYEPTTNWFDKLCEALSSVLG